MIDTNTGIQIVGMSSIVTAMVWAFKLLIKVFVKQIESINTQNQKLMQTQQEQVTKNIEALDKITFCITQHEKDTDRHITETRLEHGKMLDRLAEMKR